MLKSSSVDHSTVSFTLREQIKGLCLNMAGELPSIITSFGKILESNWLIGLA